MVNRSESIRVGVALAVIPVTGGTLFWGLYGGDISNNVGKFAEEVIFD